MDKDQAYVKHILDSIGFVENFAKDKNLEELRSNRIVQNVIVREIEIIGEAVKRLSEDFKNAHPYIPWKDIAGMRDRLIHDYFQVDHQIVWNVLKTDLPKLKSALQP